MNIETRKKEIGNRLLKLRETLGITQIEMGERTGISRSYLGYVENGKQSPSFDIIYKISETYDISTEWLIFGRGQMEILPKDYYLNLLSEKYIKFTKKYHSLSSKKQDHLLKIFENIIELPK